MEYDTPVIGPDGIAAFDQLAQPVGAFDRKTLKFLFMNKFGQDWLSYGENELADMTITEIHLKQDRDAIRRATTEALDRPSDARTWRVATKSGDIRATVQVWRQIRFRDRDAVLATISDVTDLEAARREKAALAEENAVLREPGGHAITQIMKLFGAVPGSIAVLRPGSHEILAVNDAYTTATMTRREDLLNKSILEAFPDNPDDPAGDWSRRLQASLRRVETLGEPDAMGVLRHPIRGPDGTFEERDWIILNVPVFGPTGEMAYLMHRIEDVTDLISYGGPGGADPMASTDADRIAPEILSRFSDMHQALTQLQEEQARRSAVDRLLHLGWWEYDPDTGGLHWSDPVLDLLGVPKDGPTPDLEAYLARVHPDDRDRTTRILEKFIRTGEPSLEFEHRILRPDGSVAYLRVVGERQTRAGREILVAFVQDITGYVATRESLTLTEHLVKLAGEKARLGGWRVELDPVKVIWTPGAAAIHEMPSDHSPSLEEALGYFPPEDRARIAAAYANCVSNGEDYDEVCQLVTAKGSRIWVRAIGSAIRDAAGQIVGVQGAFQDITQLRHAEQRADHAHREKAEILESISDAFFAVDHEWIFTYINPVAEKLLQRDRDSLLGQSIWEEFPAAVGSTFQIEYQRAVETGATVRFEEFYPPLDIWVEVTAYPTADGLAVYFRDISEQRKKSQQLRLLESAVSRLNDILLITEAAPIDAPEGPRIVYVNDAFCRLTGYERDEAIGKTPRMLQGPNTDRGELDRIRDALTYARPVRAELLNYSKSGEEYWLEMTIAPLVGADGKPTHFVAIARDVTERKLLQEAQRISEERFRMVSRATNDVVWDWDIRAGTLWWNERVQRLFGHDPASLEPGVASWINRVHPEDRERVLDGLDKVLNGDESTWSDEFRFRRADGSDAFVQDHGFVLRGEDGEALRMVGSMRDATEQRALEAQLRESQKLEAVGQLTGGVAHDFNNLLTIILGNAEMLSEKLRRSAELHKMAEMTAAAAERGAKLTSQLLAFARRQTLEPRSLDANHFVHGMQELVRRTVSEDIDIEVLGGPDTWPVKVDQAQLESAVLNLAINARDAMPEGGKLTIETANRHLDGDRSNQHGDVRPGEYVMIAVTDNGTGMEPEIAKRVFEPFFTTKEVGRGTGLGLSMVLGFVKQSQGHIEVSSELGHGTTIRMYFPRSQESTLGDAGQHIDEGIFGGTEHILIAEDDELVGELLSTQLWSLGYRVTIARNGPEALDRLRQFQDIDMLITDVVMPGGMSGRHLADAAMQLRPKLKILFVSGYAATAIVHEGRLDPGVEFLSKPFRRTELATKVRHILDGN